LVQILSKEYEMTAAQSARVLDTVLDTIVEVRRCVFLYLVCVSLCCFRLERGLEGGWPRSYICSNMGVYRHHLQIMRSYCCTFISQIRIHGDARPDSICSLEFNTSGEPTRGLICICCRLLCLHVPDV
jgi:hypothetical protein